MNRERPRWKCWPQRAIRLSIAAIAVLGFICSAADVPGADTLIAWRESGWTHEAARRVHSGADADDLVQLILERAMSKTQEAHIDNIASWLFGIARNAIADHYRAQARLLNHEADALEATPALGETDAERAEVIACMEPLLNALSASESQLLRWADMEGRSIQSIADELGISLTAAKSRVQRARKELLRVTQHCCVVTTAARGRVTHLRVR